MADQLLSNSFGITLPKVVLGTSSLGNLYVALPYNIKLAIVSAYINACKNTGPAFFDTAGKYGAGLALESLGQCLSDLNVKQADVLISNKLGWLRCPLTGPEPTFERDVWKDLKYDSRQAISFSGILECYEQGISLLNGYDVGFVSVHDPDEYLAAAADESDEQRRYQDILDAYEALNGLKDAGKVSAIGVGAKDWKVIAQIERDVKLDWVMIANSMTVHSHPKALIAFMTKLEQQGTRVINSAVFNAGFLTGGDHYNYRHIDAVTEEGRQLFAWRERFFSICSSYALSPAAVCVKFGMAAPGVNSIALSTSNPARVLPNINLINTGVPDALWKQLHHEGLISQEGFEIILNSKNTKPENS